MFTTLLLTFTLHTAKPTVHPTETPRPSVSCSVKESPHATHQASYSPKPTTAPTQSPTTTASASPTSTPEGIRTPESTPLEAPRSDLTDGRSDNLGCSVKDCSGNRIPTKEEVLAAELPATGSEDSLYYVLVSVGACVVAGIGFKLRAIARRMEE